MMTSKLPERAKSEPTWPIRLDHCFGRVILDQIIGKGETSWKQIIKKGPAYKQMSEEQLRQAIDLGEKILSGEANLDTLDSNSLRVRGKSAKKPKKKVLATMIPPTLTSTKPGMKRSVATVTETEQGVRKSARISNVKVSDAQS